MSQFVEQCLAAQKEVWDSNLHVVLFDPDNNTYSMQPVEVEHVFNPYRHVVTPMVRTTCGRVLPRNLLVSDSEAPDADLHLIFNKVLNYLVNRSRRPVIAW
jgi:hypothetical protein